MKPPGGMPQEETRALPGPGAPSLSSLGPGRRDSDCQWPRRIMMARADPGPGAHSVAGSPPAGSLSLGV